MKRKGRNCGDAEEMNSVPPAKKLAPIFVMGASKSSTKHEPAGRMPNYLSSWSQALRETALHPEQHKQEILELTDEAVVIRDVYPKARKHYLVVARKDGLDALSDVQKQDGPLLQHMHSLGKAWAERCLKDDSSLVFRLGYHSVPSMRQLHLHVISQDFDSPCMKNKKHWNSFTTSFFRDSKDVLTELEQHGRVLSCTTEVEADVAKADLRCHRCRTVLRNIPQLKKHISICKRPFAVDGAHLIASNEV